jgi:hypothetical protein
MQMFSASVEVEETPNLLGPFQGVNPDPVFQVSSF